VSTCRNQWVRVGPVLVVSERGGLARRMVSSAASSPTSLSGQLRALHPERVKRVRQTTDHEQVHQSSRRSARPAIFPRNRFDLDVRVPRQHRRPRLLRYLHELSRDQVSDSRLQLVQAPLRACRRVGSARWKNCLWCAKRALWRASSLAGNLDPAHDHESCDEDALAPSPVAPTLPDRPAEQSSRQCLGYPVVSAGRLARKDAPLGAA
jgi:hypothetical protein